MSWGDSQWAPYVPVAQKKANAVRHAAQLAKKQGREMAPVKLAGRKIATTFWGQSWCQNLEAYSDYANRLPRGATYVRNGSVVDLVIKPRSIEAIVAGSETYKITINIDGLAKPTWKKIKQECSASIDSLLDLLAGRFSDGVMQRLTRQQEGLFPSPHEIKMKCSCPDYSDCCKHLAAVMYGVGARLDKQPELLFVLRDVDHQELVSQAVAEGNLDRELSGHDGSLVGEDLGALFGIELDTTPTSPQPTPAKSKPKRKLAGSHSQSRQRLGATRGKTPSSSEVGYKGKEPIAKKSVTKRSTGSTKAVAKKKAKKAVTKTRTKTANTKLSARKKTG